MLAQSPWLAARLPLLAANDFKLPLAKLEIETSSFAGGPALSPRPAVSPGPAVSPRPAVLLARQ